MNKGNCKEPNFIIGGTAAGGTSFLTTMLVQHPQVYLPAEMRPEPHYFYKSWEYKEGIDYYLSRWFSNVPEECIAIGERSSSYLFGGSTVAKKIAEQFPNMKLIFTLRNPIERTWANYRYTVLEGLEDLNFSEALEKEAERISKQSGVWAEIQPYNYTGRGFYGEQLLDYMKFFDISNVLIIKSEFLADNINKELLKAYKFLNLTDLAFHPKRTPDHTSLSVVDPKLQKEMRDYFGDRFDKIVEAIRKEEDATVFIHNSQDSEAMQSLKCNLKAEKEPMPLECRMYLRSLFAKDMEILREIVDFDISDWV